MHPHRRIRHAVIGLLVFCFSFAPARGEPSDAQLACELREALGFGARTLAALGVSGTTYAQIDTDAESFVDANRETVEPLLAEVGASRRALVRAIETQEDVPSAEQAYLEAVDDLETASGSVVSTMDGRLTTEQRAPRARVDDNRLLDVPLALLELTGPQRADLLTAQRARDAVVKHHKDRKNPASVEAALAAFAQAVEAALTEGQESELATLEATLRANWQALAAHDETVTAP